MYVNFDFLGPGQFYFQNCPTRQSSVYTDSNVDSKLVVLKSVRVEKIKQNKRNFFLMLFSSETSTQSNSANHSSFEASWRPYLAKNIDTSSKNSGSFPLYYRT